MTFLRLCLLVSASTLFTIPALAQTEQSGQPEPGGDDLHTQIVVTTAGLGRLDLLAGTSVVVGTELQRNLDGQVGEVLAKLPGVSTTSFAPGASRPVLRGLEGERVRVLTDGVGTIDASSTSADHGVALDPLIAERIEVLRGPAVLLYGSQAIGGAVNVITKRIPPRVPIEPVHLDAAISADTAYDRRSLGLSVDVPLTANIALHFDGSHLQTAEVAVPGYVLAPNLRAELLADADVEAGEGHLQEAAELRQTANQSGKLPGSGTNTDTAGAGIAFFSGNSNLGLSVSYYNTQYGVPERPGAGHAHDAAGMADEAAEAGGGVTIGMTQYRADLRGVLDLGDGLFEEARTRIGYSDYTHTEFEGGAVGTIFDVTGVEGRLEMVQNPRDIFGGQWRGSIGGQYSQSDFEAIGAEAFVPPNQTKSFAMFAVQELAIGDLEAEFGGRYEYSSIDVPILAQNRSFGTVSAALGLSYGLLNRLRVGLNLSRAERAPSAQELFAGGPHVATQQFELGNPNLSAERALGFEAYLRGAVGPATITASAYYNSFNRFIYLAETGDMEDDLPVFQFLQQGAEQYGVEAQVTLPVYETGGFTLLTDLRGDYVRATLADGSPVPRMPPLSLLGALEAKSGHFDARGEVQWFAAQKRISAFETPTGGFTFVNLSIAWHPLEGDDNVTLMAQADNVLNAEGRRAASFTKDFVPLAGRNFKLSLRMSL